MKLWKYNHYSDVTKTIAEGQAIKEPLVWSLEAPDATYSDITTDELLYSHEFELIKTRKRDGEKAYQETQAKMRVDRLKAGVDHTVFKTMVYDPMHDVIELVNTGNWLDAYTALGSVQTNAILDEEMKTDFRLKISKYLCDSGNYEEFDGSSYDSSGIIT